MTGCASFAVSVIGSAARAADVAASTLSKATAAIVEPANFRKIIGLSPLRLGGTRGFRELGAKVGRNRVAVARFVRANEASARPGAARHIKAAIPMRGEKQGYSANPLTCRKADRDGLRPCFGDVAQSRCC